MGINIDSIMNRLSRYTKTKEGKEIMSEYIESNIVSGKSFAIESQPIIDTARMKSLADTLINDIIMKADAAGLPEGVMRVLKQLSQKELTKVGVRSSTWSIEIGFPDGNSLYRPSLFDERRHKHTGKGINNIVSLFDTGYSIETKGHVYGLWKGHEKLGIVRNRKHRPSIGFMSAAVTEFNTVYGTMYNCKATIVADKKYYKR